MAILNHFYLLFLFSQHGENDPDPDPRVSQPGPSEMHRGTVDRHRCELQVRITTVQIQTKRKQPSAGQQMKSLASRAVNLTIRHSTHQESIGPLDWGLALTCLPQRCGPPWPDPTDGPGYIIWMLKLPRPQGPITLQNLVPATARSMSCQKTKIGGSGLMGDLHVLLPSCQWHLCSCRTVLCYDVPARE